ncbi:MAG: rod shape-determining protein MreD [Clostridiaceae bacterium]
MKKIGLLIIISMLLLILDNSVMPFFSVRGAYPSLLYIFIIYYSLNKGYTESILIGIFAGFLQDIYFSNGIGINMLTNMLTCILAAYVGNLIIREKKLIPVFLTFFLTFIKGTLIFVILYVDKKYFAYSQVLYNSLYNLILGFFLYRIIYNFCQRDIVKANWKL